jgi:hypothetical protein
MLDPFSFGDIVAIITWPLALDEGEPGFLKVLLGLGEHASEGLADQLALVAVALAEPVIPDQKIDAARPDAHRDDRLVPRHAQAIALLLLRVAISR